ncbi:MAG: hypothetical protein ACRD8Z_22820, partial [Nitrososphaeraceae archaeon]
LSYFYNYIQVIIMLFNYSTLFYRPSFRVAHQRLARRQSVESNYSLHLEIRTVDVGMYKVKNSLRGYSC